MAIKVELCGRLVKRPEVRTTPAGMSAIELIVDCGRSGAEFLMSVVMAGESVRDLAQSLRPGNMVRAEGTLREVRSRTAHGLIRHLVEVIADDIRPGTEQMTDRS